MREVSGCSACTSKGGVLRTRQLAVQTSLYTDHYYLTDTRGRSTCVLCARLVGCSVCVSKGSVVCTRQLAVQTSVPGISLPGTVETKDVLV